MVASYPVAALGGNGHAAEDVAAANDDAHFDAHGACFGNVGGNAVGNRHIDTEALASHQGFTGGFE
ncbi:hypothetical protein D3C86_2264180 [compost metagenome]